MAREAPSDVCGTAQGPLPGLKPVLDEWLALMCSDWGKEDAPWWYNERASVSQFAGAVWRRGGWVFEEYSVNRKSPAGKHDGCRRGRCDLMFEFGDMRVVAEAKQLWLPWTLRGSAFARVDHALRRAWLEVNTAPDVSGHYRRFGLVFVAPWVRRSLGSSPDVFDTRLRAFVDEMKTAYDAAIVAWAFPGAKRWMRSKRYRGRYYPGVLMVLAPLAPTSDA
jgi:hypothetical protein